MAGGTRSAGASVRVDGVPADFILVAACNIQDLEQVLSPLRSRISGDGYEILVETTMEDSQANRALLAQFVAQEIATDGRIPHANLGAVEAIIKEAKRRAKILDGRDGALTLRLRELGGLVRSAGDLVLMSVPSSRRSMSPRPYGEAGPWRNRSRNGMAPTCGALAPIYPRRRRRSPPITSGTSIFGKIRHTIEVRATAASCRHPRHRCSNEG